jgi:hypothetical protein
VVGLSLVGPLAKAMSVSPAMGITLVLSATALVGVLGVIMMIGLPRLARRHKARAVPPAPPAPVERPRQPV